ncbi:MAG: sulfurtransferase [Pseudomonadota bacterium]|nr:sulfurtransferase [Pseudomonadota bacterium]
MEYVNIAAYRFVELDDLESCRESLLERGTTLGLLGTVLLSREGINLMLSGQRRAIDEMKAWISRFPHFAGMAYRESLSGFAPFDRMKVRVRDEIISLGRDEIRPRAFTGPRIPPEMLRHWLDEGRKFTLLDTRNDYETTLGTFDRAVTLDIDSFRELPDAVQRLCPEARSEPMVMFCTGGVRCEKASPLMLNMGFREIYQLDGGILNYFRHCGGAHWEGECFVFDHRVGLTPDLQPTRTRLCMTCQRPIGPQTDCLHCGPADRTPVAGGVIPNRSPSP